MCDPSAVMIFAAGFGTRMRHLTADRPKPLVEVAGVPLIDRTLELVRGINPDRIVVNLHYRADMLATHLDGTGVATLIEAPRILDTGGGLRNAVPQLGAGPVFTTNSDAIWDGPNPLALLKAAWDPERMDGLLMCVPTGQAVGRKDPGDFLCDSDGRLTRGPGVVYGGTQIIRTELLAGVPDEVFSLNVLWDKMIAEQRLFGVIYPGRWCDIGHPEGIGLAEAVLEGADV